MENINDPKLPNLVQARIALNDTYYTGYIGNWTQLNVIQKHLESKKKQLIYKGEGLSKSKEMYCIFQVSGKNGEFYLINNDIVFTFQKTGKPVRSNKKTTDFEEKGA